MATPAGRPTYGGWLDQIAQEGRTDDYGLVATAWFNAQANGRPKYHAPKSVNRWLSEHAPPGVANLQATLHQLEQRYHNQSGLPAPSGQVTAPLAPSSHQDPGQATDEAQDWFTSPEGQAWLASPEGQAWLAAQHPEQTLANVMAGQDPVQGELYPAQPADDPAIVGHPEITGTEPPEHPWQVVMLRLAEIEQHILGFWQAMAPLIELVAESARVEAAIDASQLAQPSAAQARARQIAAEHGWTPGPEIPSPQPPSPPVDFYGGHVVPQPDFGRMAAESDGREDQ